MACLKFDHFLFFFCPFGGILVKMSMNYEFDKTRQKWKRKVNSDHQLAWLWSV